MRCIPFHAYHDPFHGSAPGDGRAGHHARESDVLRGLVDVAGVWGVGFWSTYRAERAPMSEVIREIRVNSDLPAETS